MSIETLKERLPPYAKDIKLNLSGITNTAALSEQQLWGTMLAAALAARNATVIEAVGAEAARRLSAEAQNAARAAAAIMAMNNVYYRALHLLGDAALSQMPARLRMTAIGNPGVEKADFELWSLAVSAVNGCGMCLEAHARELAGKGLGLDAVQDALRIAAVIHAVAAVLDGEAALPAQAAAA